MEFVDLIKKGEKLIGCPIEIEFALNINDSKIDEFCFLQIKPMTIENYNDNININKIFNVQFVNNLIL